QWVLIAFSLFLPHPSHPVVSPQSRITLRGFYVCGFLPSRIVVILRSRVGLSTSAPLWNNRWVVRYLPIPPTDSFTVQQISAL
ncbi:hypothetical protein B0H13DRAFT_1960907, partial [Mycena leptocephala]